MRLVDGGKRWWNGIEDGIEIWGLQPEELRPLLLTVTVVVVFDKNDYEERDI